jgi:hypothetical protein
LVKKRGCNGCGKTSGFWEKRREKEEEKEEEEKQSQNEYPLCAV